MPQRLATNYANAYFTLGEDELDHFVSMISEEDILVSVKIFDNGDREISLADGHDDIHLTFRRLSGNRFVCSGSYLITDLTLANAMRKAMRRFKGHGIVHRIYESFTIVYHYDDGSVVRIEEVNGGQETVLFEANKDSRSIKTLEEMFQRTDTEQKIAKLRKQADQLLDLRNWANRVIPEQIPTIDNRLADVSKQLFMLEA